MNYEVVLTAEQAQDRSKWLDARRIGIGGSEAATIVNLNKWSSPYQLWLEKTGQVEADDISDKEPVYWGTQLEDMVAREFCKRTGKKVIRQGLFRSKELPWALASIDRRVVGEEAGLECKTANAFKVKEWEGDEIPNSYYVQCQHYMMVTGFKKWYIAVLLGGQHFVWKEVQRDEDDIEALKEAEAKFWEMVQSKTAPEVDGFSATTEYLGKKYQGGIKDIKELNTGDINLIKRLSELEIAQNNIKLEADKIKNSLKESLGDNEHGKVGNYMVHWTTVAGRKTLDSKAIQKDLPDVYAKYMKVGSASRRFTYEVKEEE